MSSHNLAPAAWNTTPLNPHSWGCRSLSGAVMRRNSQRAPAFSGAERGTRNSARLGAIATHRLRTIPANARNLDGSLVSALSLVA